MPSVLVAGPPCGGKTTYARLHAPAAATVLDFDDIVETLTGDRYAPRTPTVLAEARRRFHAAIPHSDWVIWTAPRRAQRGRFRTQHHARVVVVTAPLEVCLTRAAKHRPPEWQAAIHEWFRHWEPSRSGNETIVTTGT